MQDTLGLMNFEIPRGFKADNPLFRLTICIVLQALIDSRDEDPEIRKDAEDYINSEVFEADCWVLGTDGKDMRRRLSLYHDMYVERLKKTDFIKLF